MAVSTSSVLVAGACVLVACIVFAVGRSNAEPMNRAMISAVGCVSCAALVYSVQCPPIPARAHCSDGQLTESVHCGPCRPHRCHASDCNARVDKVNRTSAHQRKLLIQQLQSARMAHANMVEQRNQCEEARRWPPVSCRTVRDMISSNCSRTRPGSTGIGH